MDFAPSVGFSNLDFYFTARSADEASLRTKAYHPFVKRMQLIDAVARVGLLDGWA
jgi:hypothetical protein